MSREIHLNTTCARSMWALDAREYMGSGWAYWFEWNHPLEMSKPFSGIMRGLEEQHWAKMLPAGCTGIDIGAHSGDTSIAMGLFNYDKTNGRRGHVVAVEPNPDLYDLVTLCLQVNSHVANFRLETCAITDRDMEEVLLSDHGNANCNGGVVGEFSDSLKQAIEKQSRVTYKARGRTLASMVASCSDSFSADSVKFVKTDCEGFDKEILRSSRDFFDQIKPALFVEWFDWFGPEEDDSFFSIIDDCGYVALNPFTLAPVDRTQRTPDVTCIHKSLYKGSSPSAFSI